ncbi:amino acid transporter-like protein [Amniculicola lignicola CBS 123094]|uniref:Amino acid transporter-like protein n=1 Tax=Amniculicola lignicola CBS 123094 TaxID=1392246 RepID=A0A6A5VZR0_9PLEO|nr:amino acid transporter-like protein [Amniculicola lignicola CBS 123094]
MGDNLPESSRPRAVPSSSTEASGRSSPVAESLSRGQSTARLASPVPSQLAGSPALRQIPTPSQLATEEPLQIQSPLPGLGVAKSSLPGPGESALSSALRDSFGRGSPTRFGTPPVRALSPDNTSLAPRGPGSNYGSFDGRGRSPGGPYEDPEIIRRHLAGPQKPSNSNLSQYGSPSRSQPAFLEEEEERGRPGSSDSQEFSSLRLQGGDITRQIYRWTEQQELEERQKLKRSQSFHSSRPKPEDHTLNIDSIKQPGGFRRNYLRRAAGGSPSPAPGPSNYGATGQGSPSGAPFTSNFLEFLTLYGHFAGETLEEDDEVLGPDEYFSSEAYDSGDHTGDEDREYGESSALLTPGKKRRKRKDKKAGNGTPTGAALLLLKSFVGTGVLFLPRAFLNGGMVFSNVVLLGVAALSYYCFVLLVGTRLVVEASFGDMGFLVYGKWMRNLINFSLVISQIGFSSAYIVFVSENMQAFVLAVSKCKTYIDIKYMILMQMIIFLPLSLYRNINNIQKLALIADVFILLGLVYLYYYDLFTIVNQGGVAKDIAAFNPKDWTLFIGTAIFTFEGIGLIIPIQSGMKNPKKFPKVLAGVMVIITVVFLSMGALSYAAYGSKTKTVIILNMPQDNKFVNGVQFIYSLAILLSTPLQIYPAIEITSQQLFSRTGKYNPYIKWKKNFFRFFMVMVCALLAWVGANDLDKFVSLVGSFACIPLVYIYPPMLHYKAVARSSTARVTDVLLCILGLVGMAYTTSLTVSNWVNSGPPKAPNGYCDSI